MSSQTGAIITQTGPHWQVLQADAVTSLEELGELLDLQWPAPEKAREADRQFPLRIPRCYVRRMRRGDPEDPLLRQVLAAGAEMDEAPGYGVDPVGEGDASPVPGVLHKYRGRALLMVTGACAVHCRYCFRRHFPYEEHTPAPQRLEQALAWLAGREEIEEVILSGGDPLSLTDRRLAELVNRLAEIPHLRRLRIHSRLPVVIPERITGELVALLGDARWQSVLVLHANHARELVAPLDSGVARLRGAGVQLFNQAVLLAGVNDTVAAQDALARALFDTGVLPYYLHQLDPVAGAAHFQVPDRQARDLHRQLRGRLPGYLVPELVREIAGEDAKTPLFR